MRALRAFGFAALLFGAACAAPMKLPKEFVELRDPGEGFRAMTSDGARLRLRDLAEPTDGGAEFWADTLRIDLVQQRGYQQLDAGEVKNANGEPGRWLRFAANVDGERYGYFVAVWAVDPWWPLASNYLRVVEFSGREDVFAPRLDAVREALATVR